MMLIDLDSLSVSVSVSLCISAGYSSLYRDSLGGSRRRDDKPTRQGMVVPCSKVHRNIPGYICHTCRLLLLLMFICIAFFPSCLRGTGVDTHVCESRYLTQHPELFDRMRVDAEHGGADASEETYVYRLNTKLLNVRVNIHIISKPYSFLLMDESVSSLGFHPSIHSFHSLFLPSLPPFL
jgi:hypothetical protein